MLLMPYGVTGRMVWISFSLRRAIILCIENDGTEDFCLPHSTSSMPLIRRLANERSIHVYKIKSPVSYLKPNEGIYIHFVVATLDYGLTTQVFISLTISCQMYRMSIACGLSEDRNC